MRKLSVDEIRSIQVELLVKLSKLCEKYHLRYYLGGGTLLGAIRHKGFIPWDDDVDVMMPREDFDCLMKMGIRQNKKERIHIESFLTKGSPYPFIKLIDSHTLVKEKYMDKKHMIGVWIDIFPLDGLPEDMRIVKRLFHETRLCRFLLETAISEPGKGSTQYAAAAKNVLVPILRHIDTDALCNRMHVTAKSYRIEDVPYLGSLLWGYGPQERVPVSFLDPVMVKFEGIFFPGPSCYDQYLSQLYGDYMKLPPKNKRIQHGFDAWAIDGETRWF